MNESKCLADKKQVGEMLFWENTLGEEEPFFRTTEHPKKHGMFAWNSSYSVWFLNNLHSDINKLISFSDETSLEHMGRKPKCFLR